MAGRRLFHTTLCEESPLPRRPPCTFRGKYGRLEPRRGERGVPLLVRHLMMHALIQRGTPSTRWASEPTLFQQRGLLQVEHTPDRAVLSAHLHKIAKKYPPKYA